MTNTLQDRCTVDDIDGSFVPRQVAWPAPRPYRLEIDCRDDGHAGVHACIERFASTLSDGHAGPLPPDALHYVQLMHEGAHEMSALIDHLLSFSRVGIQAMHPGKFAIFVGGFPIEVDGEVVGGVGVSGGNGEQDTQVGEAGIAAFLRAITR